MKVRHRFRFYPDAHQADTLERLFGCVRYVYNRALALRISIFKESGQGLNYCASSAALTSRKREAGTAWLREPSCVPLQQALRHLDAAYSNFFQKRAKYPAFKRKHGSKQSAEFTLSGFVWDQQNQNLTVAKIGRLNIRWSRVIKTKPSSVTITKDAAGRFFVTLTIEEARSKLPPAESAVGVDLGIRALATLSTGEVIAPLNVFNREIKSLRKAQRVLSRRVKGSGRRNRQKIKVARLHAKVADTRKDFLDKLTTGLVRRFGVIAIEDLNVRGMIRNRRLARRISDAGFSEFRRMLEYKCSWYGREFRIVRRYEPTSKRCSNCGDINQALTLADRVWSCACGANHDRDVNAAVNILAAGHAVAARGERVSRLVTSVTKRSARRSVNHPKMCNV
jgi:putative transposase